MYYYEVIEMYRRIVLLGVLPVSYKTPSLHTHTVWTLRAAY